MGINSTTFDHSQSRRFVSICAFGSFLDSFVYPDKDMRDIQNWNPVDVALLNWMQENWNDPEQTNPSVSALFSLDDLNLNLQIFNSFLFNFPVIKYLSKLENPETFLKKYFVAIKNNSSYLAALLHSIDTPENVWLPDYFQSLFEGNIYELSGQVLDEFYLNNPKVTLRKTLPHPDQKDTYTDDWMDLSANIYYFDMDNVNLNERSQLSFTISSKDINTKDLNGLLFSIDKMTKEISYIESGLNLKIADPLKLKDEKSDIFILIVNSRSIYLGNDRDDQLSTIQLDVSLEQILPYHHMKIYFDSVTVIRKYNNGSTYKAEKSNNRFGEVTIYEEYKGSFSKENKFTGNWDFIYLQESANDQHYKGKVTATLNPDSDLLIDFDFEINTRVLDPSGKNTYIIEDRRHIVGSNVLLQ